MSRFDDLREHYKSWSEGYDRWVRLGRLSPYSAGIWTHTDNVGRRVVGFGRLLTQHLDPRPDPPIGATPIPR